MTTRPDCPNYPGDCGDMHCTGTVGAEGCFPASGMKAHPEATVEFYNCRNHPDEEAHFLVVQVSDNRPGTIWVHAECARCSPEAFYGELLFAEGEHIHVYRLPGAEAAIAALA